MNSEPVAVVTGGGSGIGEAAAQRLAAAGYRLAILDINRVRAAAMVEAIGHQAAFFPVDVSDAAAVDAAAAAVHAAFGRADVLVNSAGILQNATRVLDMNLGEAERILQVNYLGTVACCQAFGRMMKSAGSGSIVNLASINSFRCSAQPAYNATKTAVVSLTETLAAELGPSGVRVNAVAPGYTLTPAMQARVDSGQRDPKQILGATALGRWVLPSDVAEAVLFLCSDAAACITGITLPIDAGWLAATSYRAWAAQPG